MNTFGEIEGYTQENVIIFFRNELRYTYLGNWQEREGNSNIEKTLLSNWLKKRNHDDNLIDKTVRDLQETVKIRGSQSLYEANREVYEMLRYGVNIKPSLSEPRVTVKLIDWEHPYKNDFAIAEEVTLVGENTKRPDIVLYVNGIAIGVLELKRSTVSVSEGIRQNLNNQNKEFIRWFFTTVQLVMAGNETEGLRYSVIDTPERYWLQWREADTDFDAGDPPLHRELSQLCSKERLLEILHDFIVFDSGIKKISRHNQYFGVKAAQERIKKREGGIIWHTQGSGKSLTMVWLAKWILEHIPPARVLIVTDRTELDEQIEMVFTGVKENIKRTQSGADLVNVLRDSPERLVCSLIQKFSKSDDISDQDIDNYISEIRQNLSTDVLTKDEFFVFVDECHRTQSGKLHKAMKQLLPDAVLIGFTGTPIFKRDKQRSIEIFGDFIHIYKYDQAVRDNAVLSLRYEARDIAQHLSSEDKINQWFESKTRGLTEVAKARLRQRWVTMQNVLSSKSRLEIIVADIILDMETLDRLKSGRGNAMLVADCIYSAYRYFELFQNTELKGKCAVVTSFRPGVSAITGEDTREGLTNRQLEYIIYRKMLAEHFNESEDEAMHKGDLFESEVKKRFIKQPAQMKLLIVVDKLLTGFNAPPATYLYLDKKMQDHGLFQAICRVNRLDRDGEEKEYGYIIDYKQQFKPLQEAYITYTGEAFEDYDDEDVAGMLKDRFKESRIRLDEAREKINAFCECVPPPHDEEAYRHYFCAAESGNIEQLEANEQKRSKLYQLTAAFLRAYANLANEMKDANYSETETQEIKGEVDYYANVRKHVKLASGDYIDLKVHEPAMRHLLDTYIRSEDSETLATFDDLTLIQQLIERGKAATDMLPDGIRDNKNAIAETIENNVRRLLVDKTQVNPRYYKEMSELLDALILKRKQETLDYQEYLLAIIELCKQINNPDTYTDYPEAIDTPAKQALYDNFENVRDSRETLAVELDQLIHQTRQDNWRENEYREREVYNAIAKHITNKYPEYNLDIDVIFELVKNQNEY